MAPQYNNTKHSSSIACDRMKRNAIAALGLLSGFSKNSVRITAFHHHHHHQSGINNQNLVNYLFPHPFSTTTATTTVRSMSATSSAAAPNHGVVEAAIQANLQESFAPVEHLEVRNESHMHNVPKNSETHFKVVIVSPIFESVTSPIQRHRLVHKALHNQLMDNGGTVHALSIVAKSPQQWKAMIDEGKTLVPPSPKCKGGDGSLPKP